MSWYIETSEGDVPSCLQQVESASSHGASDEEKSTLDFVKRTARELAQKLPNYPHGTHEHEWLLLVQFHAAGHGNQVASMKWTTRFVRVTRYKAPAAAE